MKKESIQENHNNHTWRWFSPARWARESPSHHFSFFLPVALVPLAPRRKAPPRSFFPLFFPFFSVSVFLSKSLLASCRPRAAHLRAVRKTAKNHPPKAPAPRVGGSTTIFYFQLFCTFFYLFFKIIIKNK